VEVVETTVEIGGLALSLVHPPDADELIDEQAFEQEEFLPYWAELWPSAVALAGAVAELGLDGARVLELGCGLALPSIVAARRGADVLATDWSPDALSFAGRNAARNGVELETMLVAWESPGVLVARGAWRLVIASDVLYERRNVEPLLDLLPRLGDEVLLADPGRPALRAFLEGAETRWRIDVTAASELPRGGIHRLRAR
jgi:predicted nicotinamide N-methyase